LKSNYCQDLVSRSIGYNYCITAIPLCRCTIYPITAVLAQHRYSRKHNATKPRHRPVRSGDSNNNKYKGKTMMDEIYWWLGLITFWPAAILGVVFFFALGLGSLLNVTRERFEIVKILWEWAINMHLFKEWKAKNNYRTYDSWFKKPHRTVQTDESK